MSENNKMRPKFLFLDIPYLLSGLVYNTYLIYSKQLWDLPGMPSSNFTFY